MEKILFVNACVRPESRTMILAKRVLEKMNGQVTELDLEKEEIKPLDRERLELREKYSESGDFSDDMFKYAVQFAAADTVVIAAPYWDLSFPAMVKTYIEAISVQGITFRYSERGIPEGLTNVRKIVYVTTSGGPIGEYNMGFDYVAAVCGGLFGIGDITCHKAEMLDVVGMDVDGIIKSALDEIDAAYK